MPASNSNPPADRGGPQGRDDERAEPQAAKPLRLFEAFGIEVEYMLVDAETLDVAPAADALLEAAAGKLTDEFENGDVAWTNELALHVIEFKCNGPRPSLVGLGEAFAANVALANAKLDRDGRRLMPTAMHPWMDPADVVLWPHGSARDLRGLRPHLRLQGPRLGQSAEHAHQPAVPRRRGVRPAARRDPVPAADPAGPRRELADHRRRAERRPRQPARRLPRQLRGGSRR